MKKKSEFSSLELRILRLIHEWTYGHVNMLDENGRDPHGHARTIQNCDIPDAIIKGWMASELDSDIRDCLHALGGLGLTRKSHNKRLPLPNPCYMRRSTNKWVVIIFHGADSNGGFFKVCARRNIANGVVSAGRWHQSIWFEPYGFVVYRLTAKGLASVRDSRDDVAKGNAGRPVGSFHKKSDTRTVVTDDECHAWLLHLKGKSYREIGMEQGVSHETARQRCLRAKKISNSKPQSIDLSKAVELTPNYSDDKLPAQRTKRQRQRKSS